MKKRQHSLQTSFSINLNGSHSFRALRSSTRTASREMSTKLASATKDVVSESAQLKLADEISSTELKQFALSCIESLATLTAAKKPYIVDALMGVIAARLPSYGDLVSELHGAKAELTLQKQSIKQQGNSPKVLETVIGTMCQKHCVENLNKRIQFLQNALPSHVAKTGAQLGFPAAIMNKVVKVVGVALEKSI